MLQITPASTNPTFTERGLWNVFRICGRDDQQGTFVAGYLLKHYKAKNIAIVNDKSTYGAGLAAEVKKALNKNGVKEKLNDSYNKGDNDFTALASKLKRDKIDIIFVGGYHKEAGQILRQMRRLALLASATLLASTHSDFRSQADSEKRDRYRQAYNRVQAKQPQLQRRNMTSMSRS